MRAKLKACLWLLRILARSSIVDYLCCSSSHRSGRIDIDCHDSLISYIGTAVVRDANDSCPFNVVRLPSGLRLNVSTSL